jgi:hypothetical protein
MDSEATGDPGAVAALEASRRLERSRRAALNLALAERRRHAAARVALSLAEILSEESDATWDLEARA